jgi:hypothetical protein
LSCPSCGREQDGREVWHSWEGEVWVTCRFGSCEGAVIEGERPVGLKRSETKRLKGSSAQRMGGWGRSGV